MDVHSVDPAACNLLCFALDHHFHYFGGSDAPILFLTNEFVSATVGGVLAGLLLFTGKEACSPHKQVVKLTWVFVLK